MNFERFRNSSFLIVCACWNAEQMVWLTWQLDGPSSTALVFTETQFMEINKIQQSHCMLKVLTGVFHSTKVHLKLFVNQSEMLKKFFTN